MPAVILDACGTLNLYASGRFVSILTALKHEWYLPAAVERESQQYRQPDPADAEKLVVVPIDLAPILAGGFLKRCDCESDDEADLYVELAAKIGDDGESMGLAIAKCRGWSVMTDDRKARRLAQELGVPVLGTPEVMKEWAKVAKPGTSKLSEVLLAIERFSNYRPKKGVAQYEWWIVSIKTGKKA